MKENRVLVAWGGGRWLWAWLGRHTREYLEMMQTVFKEIVVAVTGYLHLSKFIELYT